MRLENPSMVRIAPVRLAFNPKTLWFDALDFGVATGDAVVVSTARGTEFGHVSDSVFEMQYEETKKLKSPLKPLLRVATEDDVRQAEEKVALSLEALPVFKRMAAESAPDMNPIAVEYLFDGDKAVFYFDAEDRVDFRDLVRRLASELHVHVDMKQIGVRDGARMIGGLGHCGQELCCRRLGGEFNPVSIRMAKEQDLSLNPQKISGVCGRLMCCLRYEFEAYKDFHSRAPKKNARVDTPDGVGKVVDLNVPREIVSIKVGDEKPVKVPLSDMEPAEDGGRPKEVGEEAWEKATAPASMALDGAIGMFTSELSGEDKLAEPGKIRHVRDAESGQKPSRSRRRRGGSRGDESKQGEGQSNRKSRRRRTTTVGSDGSSRTASSEGGSSAKQEGPRKEGSSSRQRRNRSSSKAKQPLDNGSMEKQPSASKVGRNSSALRANRGEAQTGEKPSKGTGSGQRRRRRSHKTGPDNSEG